MGSLYKNLLPIRTFVPIDVRRLFRDKVSIFFVFIFPLVFLLVFGTIFSGDSDISFKVALINQSNSDFSQQFVEDSKQNGILELSEDAKTLEEARILMSRGELDATIILPEDFGVVQESEYPTGQAIVLYDQNNESAGQTLASIMGSIFEGINTELVPTETPFTVTTETTATKGQTRFDYTFSGLLGFTMLSLGIFGPTTVFPRLKQKGVLRRYQTTTIKVWQYFVANVISNAVVGIMAVAIMFLAAVIFFDLNMRGDYISLTIVTVAGVTMLFGIGLALGGWAKNENQAAPLAQLASFPMMFLSGVFFPVFLMPEFLQNITRFIPLTPVIEAIRLIVTEGQTVLDLGPQMAIIAGWTIIIYIIAFKVFRWE